MTVKVIIEFLAKPGQRDALQRLMEAMGKDFGPMLRERGALGFDLYEAHDNPDLIVEIGEWESMEAREALVEEAMAAGAFASMLELLANPPKAMYVKRLT